MPKIQLFTKWTCTAGLDPIFAQKRTFLIKDVWVTWVQFPLHCAAARTIHVAHSATFRDIYIDISTNTSPPKHWWKHMLYVS